MKLLIAALKSLQSHNGGRMVLKEFPEFIFQLNENGEFLDFYAADERLLAVSPDSIIGKSLHELFPPDFVQKAMTNLQTALHSDEGVTLEYSLPLENQEHYFEARLIRENENRVSAFIRDVTEIRKIKIKEAEHHRILEESERRFRLLADHLPGAVYLCNNDADFSMLYLNDKIFDITGYTPAQFISKEINFPDIYHADDIQRIYGQVEKSLKEESSFHLEYRIRHRSGTWRWLEEFGTGVYNNHELVCLEGFIQDITERKLVEQKISIQNEALTKTNEELDRFVYSASHDLRSPLSSLLGLLNLIDGTTSPEEIQLLLKKMKDRLNSMDHFIKEITYYSQNSRTEIEENEIKLYDEVQECIESLWHMEEANGLTFEVNIPKEFLLKTDKRRLKIVLNNLIANAIKYGDEKKLHRWVRLQSDLTQERFVLIVEDNGVGIQDQYQPKIFNMFYRASEKSNGSGLGLYIVKETVEKMGGRIEFTSVAGEGSSFVVCLPLT